MRRGRFPAACGRLVLVLAIALLVARPVHACSCVDLTQMGDPKLLHVMYTSADLVVHARVTAVPSPHVARIEAIEWFKGGPVSVLHGRPGGSSTCGLAFQEGAEAVFFSFSGQVSMCGLQRPTKDLLDRLRQVRDGGAAKH